MSERLITINQMGGRRLTMRGKEQRLPTRTLHRLPNAHRVPSTAGVRLLQLAIYRLKDRRFRFRLLVKLPILA
jgi:hypothetical protein